MRRMSGAKVKLTAPATMRSGGFHAAAMVLISVVLPELDSPARP